MTTVRKKKQQGRRSSLPEKQLSASSFLCRTVSTSTATSTASFSTTTTRRTSCLLRSARRRSLPDLAAPREWVDPENNHRYQDDDDGDASKYQVNGTTTRRKNQTANTTKNASKTSGRSGRRFSWSSSFAKKKHWAQRQEHESQVRRMPRRRQERRFSSPLLLDCGINEECDRSGGGGSRVKNRTWSDTEHTLRRQTSYGNNEDEDLNAAEEDELLLFSSPANGNVMAGRLSDNRYADARKECDDDDDDDEDYALLSQASSSALEILEATATCTPRRTTKKAVTAASPGSWKDFDTECDRALRTPPPNSSAPRLVSLSPPLPSALFPPCRRGASSPTPSELWNRAGLPRPSTPPPKTLVDEPPKHVVRPLPWRPTRATNLLEFCLASKTDGAVKGKEEDAEALPSEAQNGEDESSLLGREAIDGGLPCRVEDSCFPTFCNKNDMPWLQACPKGGRVHSVMTREVALSETTVRRSMPLNGPPGDESQVLWKTHGEAPMHLRDNFSFFTSQEDVMKPLVMVGARKVQDET